MCRDLLSLCSTHESRQHFTIAQGSLCLFSSRPLLYYTIQQTDTSTHLTSCFSTCPKLSNQELSLVPISRPTDHQITTLWTGQESHLDPPQPPSNPKNVRHMFPCFPLPLPVSLIHIVPTSSHHTNPHSRYNSPPNINHAFNHHDGPRHLRPLFPRPKLCRLVTRCLLPLLRCQRYKRLAFEIGS
jgi:hypothetical protein